MVCVAREEAGGVVVENFSCPALTWPRGGVASRPTPPHPHPTPAKHTRLVKLRSGEGRELHGNLCLVLDDGSIISVVSLERERRRLRKKIV